MEEKQLPKAVKTRLHGWFLTFWAFTICHYLFGIGGVLASTIAASTGDLATARVAGTIAAIFMAFIGFVKPEEKYRKHVIAWRLLDEKANYYRHGFIGTKELIDGMALAEKALDQIEREAGQPRLSTVPTSNGSAAKETADRAT